MSLFCTTTRDTAFTPRSERNIGERMSLAPPLSDDLTRSMRLAHDVGSVTTSHVQLMLFSSTTFHALESGPESCLVTLVWHSQCVECVFQDITGCCTRKTRHECGRFNGVGRHDHNVLHVQQARSHGCPEKTSERSQQEGKMCCSVLSPPLFRLLAQECVHAVKNGAQKQASTNFPMDRGFFLKSPTLKFAAARTEPPCTVLMMEGISRPCTSLSTRPSESPCRAGAPTACKSGHRHQRPTKSILDQKKSVSIPRANITGSSRIPTLIAIHHQQCHL